MSAFVAVQLTIEKCIDKARKQPSLPGLIVGSVEVVQIKLGWRKFAPAEDTEIDLNEKTTPKEMVYRVSMLIVADNRHAGDDHTIVNGCQKARKKMAANQSKN